MRPAHPRRQQGTGHETRRAAPHGRAWRSAADERALCGDLPQGRGLLPVAATVWRGSVNAHGGAVPSIRESHY
jgi:hypothetical protein